MKPKRIYVLGAGIIGLSSAVRLSEAFPDAKLEIISEKFSPETTSDVAAGLWGPYLLGDTPEPEIRQWSQETHQYFHQLWKSGFAEGCGICLVTVDELYQAHEPAPWWRDIVFGFQPMDAKQLVTLSEQHGQRYVTGFRYVTFTCEPTKIMRHYRDILRCRSVNFRLIRLDDFQQLANYIGPADRATLVVNCLGLGSRDLLADQELCPVRGQVQKVRAGGIFHSVATDTAYIIPNTETITLGGTKQKHNSNGSVCPVDRAEIRNACEILIPALRRADTIGDVVGLRPMRSRVRLELMDTGAYTLVHNYGHGGAGITLAWGCAGKVVESVLHHRCAKL